MESRGTQGGPRPGLCTRSPLPSRLQQPRGALLALLWVARPSVGITSNTGAPSPLPAADTHTQPPHFIRFQEGLRINSPKQGSPEAAPLRRDSETTPPHPSPHQHLPWIMAPAAPLTPCTCPIFLWDSPRCDRETAARGGDLTVSESLRRETRGGMDVQSPALLEPPRRLLSCDVSVIR